MKTATFKTEAGERTVTRDEALAGMTEFDLRFRLNEEDSGTKYAVEEDGKRYPPKRILELATGVPVSNFSGGKPTNHVFCDLGFNVLTIAPNQHTWKTAEEVALEEARLKLPIPNVEQLVEGLFGKVWFHLHRDYSKVSIPRQSRGLYFVSRSKRLFGVANAAPYCCHPMVASYHSPIWSNRLSSCSCF